MIATPPPVLTHKVLTFQRVNEGTLFVTPKVTGGALNPVFNWWLYIFFAAVYAKTLGYIVIHSRGCESCCE